MPYFSTKELTCNCGCGLNAVDPNALAQLTTARKIADIPFPLNRSISCEVHNASIKGFSPTSSHLNGTAFDIACDNSRSRMIIIQALMDAGFNRIGVAKTFIHADVDPAKPEYVLWTY